MTEKIVAAAAGEACCQNHPYGPLGIASQSHRPDLALSQVHPCFQVLHLLL